MTTNIIRRLVRRLVPLLVGTMFGIWLEFDHSSLSAAVYAKQQQAAVHARTTALPLVGATCIELSATLQPLKRLIMTWSVQAPPANWTDLCNT